MNFEFLVRFVPIILLQLFLLAAPVGSAISEYWAICRPDTIHGYCRKTHHCCETEIHNYDQRGNILLLHEVTRLLRRLIHGVMHKSSTGI